MDTKPGIKLTDLTNESTFERVFRTYYGQLCGFATGYVEDTDVAEEIVQEMFTNLWTKASEIEIQLSLKSYLYGAVRNACLNYFKHQKVRQNYARDKASWWNDGDFEDVLELEELQEKISRALDKLPPKCREVFELSRFDEKKYKEIADELGISVKTVENQMGKALQILRSELEPYLPLIVMVLSYLLMMELTGVGVK